MSERKLIKAFKEMKKLCNNVLCDDCIINKVLGCNILIRHIPKIPMHWEIEKNA